MRLLFVALMLLVASPLRSQSTAGLYEEDTLRTFYFTFASATWYSDLQQARSNGTNVKADLSVDGLLYRDVGTRFRGRSSYSGAGYKKSINVTMDAFVPGQKLMGYDSLNLSNGFNDPTLCREVISYRILRRYLPAPKANYVRVFINNSYFGLYINVQQMDETFIKEWHKGSGGNRYRCDPPTRAGAGNSALQWLGTTLQNYKDAYELKTDPAVAVRPWEDIRTLCNVLNNTSNNLLATELPKVLDVDRALWYLAANIVMVNLDSYADRGNDYYIYHDTQHDRFGMLPWDMNESFGGYDAGMSVSSRISLSPFHNQGLSYRPLLPKLFTVVTEWRQRYIHHVKTIVDESFQWNFVGPLVARHQLLIDASVQSDPNLLYTYQMFKDNVTTQMFVNSGPYRNEIPGLKQICDGRHAYISNRADYKAVRAAISGLTAPVEPPPNTAATITARVTSAGGIGSVTLFYRDVGVWQTAPMLDDGNHGDGLANDGVFGGFVPASVQKPGRKIEYYVGVLSSSGSGGAANYSPKTAAFDAPSYRVGYPTRSSPIAINELVAKNISGIRDEKGEYEDWLELHNASSSAVVVGGMYLTDSFGSTTKWKIPAGSSIPANGSLLIWCDDEPLDGPFHATFKLSSDGERVMLFDTDGLTMLSSVRFGAQVADVSNGTLIDGNPQPLVAYKTPTPAQSNSKPCDSRAYWPLDWSAHRIDLAFMGIPKIAATNTTIQVAAGPTNSSVGLYFAVAPMVLPIGNGLHLLLGTGLMGSFPIATNASGSGTLPLSIPNDPILKGVGVYMQVAGVDAIGVTVSNGVEVRICN